MPVPSLVGRVMKSSNKHDKQLTMYKESASRPGGYKIWSVEQMAKAVHSDINDGQSIRRAAEIC